MSMALKAMQRRQASNQASDQAFQVIKRFKSCAVALSTAAVHFANNNEVACLTAQLLHV
jgi:hypothetical protein